jgi:hypothetical protein
MLKPSNSLNFAILGVVDGVLNPQRQRDT